MRDRTWQVAIAIMFVAIILIIIFIGLPGNF